MVIDLYISKMGLYAHQTDVFVQTDSAGCVPTNHFTKFYNKIEQTSCKKKFSIYNKRVTWERSSVWLERMPVTHEVASSSLVVPELKKSYFCRAFLIGMIMARTCHICELREGAEAGAFLRLC